MEMNGKCQKACSKREEAIAALLACGTVTAAARQAGISKTTLYCWLREPDFVADYRAARGQVVEEGIRELQAAFKKAVSALTRNLSCGQPALEIRAALAILDQSIRGMELLDIEARITALEASEDEG